MHVIKERALDVDPSVSLSDDIALKPSSQLIIAPNRQKLIANINTTVYDKFKWEGQFVVDSIRDYDLGKGIAAIIYLTNKQTNRQVGIAYASGTSFLVPLSQADHFKGLDAVVFGDTIEIEGGMYQSLVVPEGDVFEWTCIGPYCCLPTLRIVYPGPDLIYGCGCDTECVMAPGEIVP